MKLLSENKTINDLTKKLSELPYIGWQAHFQINKQSDGSTLIDILKQTGGEHILSVIFSEDGFPHYENELLSSKQLEEVKNIIAII